MSKKIAVYLVIFSIFLTGFSDSFTSSNKNVEVFDLTQSKVVKITPTNKVLQKEAEKSIRSITLLSKKVSPLPRKGALVRIPLDPAVSIKNEWMDDLVDEVIIIFGEREKPLLMVFTDENRTLFFEFNYNPKEIRTLLK
ncbi:MULTISPECIES: hypothetical protein [Priestia]|uniref:Uncharacterized protein n=1 Tax=Priestia filamentosa TaxID=1402861 RepID=A0A1X7F8Q5_9BACI|nr:MULTISPECIES: hypothetical protein [Priestia]AKO91809.1 hypothetical protein BEH_06635 [Priestia filamentosa]MCY8231109.1 hypothetical protein [Priestia endophytica]MDT3761951.1 hypothetical protein [Priestia filamentosa]OXS68036.1 hypothetical protein B1B01_15805 [Priestia filamentosa]RJS64763.1 hypothetical protein CJ485_08360 [Priestia filamentosa]